MATETTSGGESRHPARHTAETEGDVRGGAEPTNRSVVRAMLLLRELGNFPQGASALELSERVGLSRATAFRLLVSLTQSGMLTREGSVFSLGWEMARLGRRADPYRALLPRIQAILQRLAQAVEEHVSLAVALDPLTLEVIAETDRPRTVAGARSFLGMSFPLHAGAVGKVMLAEFSDDEVREILPPRLEQVAPKTITDREELIAQLVEVRSTGFATIDNESEEGLFAVSVAVRDADGALAGVLTAAGLDRRMQRTGVCDYAQRLHLAAAELSRVFAEGPEARR